MVKLMISLTEEERTAIKVKAKGLGLTTSAYVRTAAKESLSRTKDNQNAEVLQAIRALVPTLANGLGRAKNADHGIIDRFAKALLTYYDRVCTEGGFVPTATQPAQETTQNEPD